MTIPISQPSPNPTVYMQGTRRIDEMAMTARSLAYQSNYSYTEGWDDNTVGALFNLGLNRLYDRITQIDSPANIQEYTQDVSAGVQAYDVPQDVKMALQIMNVRFLYGPETWQFVTLEEGQIQDRYSYPTNIPTTWCLRNGQILLSPTPNISRPASLIINYQKRMRSLDYRRGKVTNITSLNGTVTNISNANPAQVTTSAPHGLVTGNKVGLTGDKILMQPSVLNQHWFFITVTGPTTFTLNNVDTTNAPAFAGPCLWFLNPITFSLNFTQQSQKDVNLQANANSILNLVDWISFTDRNGQPIIDAIPLNNYVFDPNTNTATVTAESNYVVPFAFWELFLTTINNQETVYVVTGDYASTHSELDRQSEDLLIEYVVLRLLRLQSAAEPTKDQLEAEEAVLQRLAIAYRRFRPSIVPIVYQQRLRARSWYNGYRGGY